MSKGVACKCEEKKKPIAQRNWVVWQYKCNHSAFSGYKKTPSLYSQIRCNACKATWRTKQPYVSQLKIDEYGK